MSSAVRAQREEMEMFKIHAHKHFLRPFLPFSLLLPLCSAAFGGPGENAVRLTVQAETIRDRKQPAGRHWVLTKLPQPKDVLISNPDVKQRFIDAIQIFANDPQRHCDVFVTDRKGGNCSFPNGMANLLSGDKLGFTGPPDALLPPTADVPDQPALLTLRASYTAASPPPPVKSLCIMAAIGTFKGICSEAAPPATNTSLKTLAAKYKLGALPPEWESIQIRTSVGPPDTWDPQEKRADRLEAVAISGFLAARQMNVLPGPNSPTRSRDLEDKLQSIWSIDDSGWPAPSISYDQETPGSAAYQLTIANLHVVKAAFVVLDKGNTIATDPKATSDKLTTRLRQSSCEVGQRFRPQLDSLVGAIPTNDGVWKIARAIGASPEVAGVVKPAFRSTPDKYPICQLDEAAAAQPDRIEFTGDHRWVIGSIDGTANIGIKANPHEIISGDAHITTDHLLFPRTASVLNSASLTVHGGPEVQRSDFAFNIGSTHGRTQRMNYGFELDGIYSRDQNQRFGYLAGPKFVDEEFGPAPKAYLEFVRPSESHRFNADLRFDLPIEFRHIALQRPSTFPLFPNRGWVTGFTPSFAVLVGYDFAPSQPSPRRSRPGFCVHRRRFPAGPQVLRRRFRFQPLHRARPS